MTAAPKMTVFLNQAAPQENEYANLVPNQYYALVKHFTLESGESLESVPVAYMTWGVLNKEKDNALVICHALSGSSDVADWWGPLLGPGKAFDTSRFFIFCGNVLGSPYGSASPLTLNPTHGRPYGPDFPMTTIRDDVMIHKMVLDALGVVRVAAVVGGSMGGMAALEWPLCFPGYVNTIVPIATSASHSAWGISWGEAQIRCICADSQFNNGRYQPTPSEQPSAGLAAARIVGMLTYRSSASFSSRFGRKTGRPVKGRLKKPDAPEDANDRGGKAKELVSTDSISPGSFSAQGYLEYQGDKFVKRFDANCYIHLTRKMDGHDITRGRYHLGVNASADDRAEAEFQVLNLIPPGALVIGVETDVLFTPHHQAQLADALPQSKLAIIDSVDGHDGFLLAFEVLTNLIDKTLRERCPLVYKGAPLLWSAENEKAQAAGDSVFGEVESRW